MKRILIATTALLAACSHFSSGNAEAPTAASAKSETKGEGWYPSRYGAGDRLGAMNNLSAEKTAEAAKLITTGKTYALGQVTGRKTPAYGPRTFNMTILQLSDGSGTPLGENKAVGNDDLVSTYVGIGSQIDGLGHMGIDHRYYNGVPVAEFVTTGGLTQFGTHTLPPVATRGVLLDMTKIHGDPVAAGTAFNRPEIERAAEAAGVTIRKGDIVLFHTGTMKAQEGMTELSPVEPGIGVEGAQYLADLGVVAIGADTWAVEVIPFEHEARPFDGHLTMLAKNGVYILENMVTDELAADGVTEFFFTLGAPRLEGAVQAIINPVAIR
ncbi:MAG: cyclase family protein [Hyphomonas sp.]|uniref:cyclase family protein n=1 Tax=Hyphomonas sp. TaxID=87 RepID=UPI0017F23CD8|nr:cyclase family protein [Hyphomonas sp.]MBA3070303.1 cyclase family protein [Hyphomonas sp.]MBU3919907.1 cyclase family protein [Alphaproteobacteria bacterium]MBU4062789.1 cyclase family protein [Alphaproteobacteria bacterium]MBU4163708.1 cyclase family protein [Alphaproteobacteria bacterium]